MGVNQLMKKAYYAVLMSLCTFITLYCPEDYVEAADSSTPVIEFHYDSRGKLLYHSLSTGEVLNYVYDANGNVIKKIKSNHGSLPLAILMAGKHIG